MLKLITFQKTASYCKKMIEYSKSIKVKLIFCDCRHLMLSSVKIRSPNLNCPVPPGKFCYTDFPPQTSNSCSGPERIGGANLGTCILAGLFHVLFRDVALLCNQIQSQKSVWIASKTGLKNQSSVTSNTDRVTQKALKIISNIKHKK